MKTCGKRLGSSLLICGLASLLIGLAPPARAATFSVDSTADAPDASPGDGICADSEGRCTLRAAIMEANAIGGTNTVDLSLISDPNTPIILDIPGADETASGSAASGFTITSEHDAAKGDLNITSSMSIVGAGPDKTVIEWDPGVKQDPAKGDRVFHIEAVSSNIEVSISGVTIRNGVTPPPQIVETNSDGTYYQFERWGGGIAIGPAAAVTLINPAVSGSESGSGGEEGGAGSGGTGESEGTAVINGVTLTDVRILDNQSGTAGGGISSAAPLTLDNVLVSGNVATTNGGGIYNDAQLTINDSTIGTMTGFTSPNSAEGGGGMFDTGMHNTLVEESAIVGNKAVGGGGISSRSLVTLNIVNTTISGNQATDVGAGITADGKVNLQNDTVAGNQAANDSTSGGAGVNAFGSGVYSFVNTLFQNNVVTGTGAAASCGCSGSSCKAGVMVTGGHNLSDDSSCFLQSAVQDQANISTQLQALAANGGPTESMALLAGTPAVDAGDNASCPPTDQRGNMRPADGNLRGSMQCDIGAFELFTPSNDLHVSGNRLQYRVRRGQPADVGFDFTNDPGASADATGVTITTEPMPQGYALSGATLTTSAGTSNCAFDGATQVVSCDVGTLARGQTASLDLKGTGTQPGWETFSAHIAAQAPADPFPDNNTVSVQMLIQGVSDVRLSVSGPGQQARVHGQTALNFSITNHGEDAANNVIVAAAFENRMSYRSMQISNGRTCVAVNVPNTAVSGAGCDVGTVAPGGTVTGTLTLEPTSTGDTLVAFEVWQVTPEGEVNELDVDSDPTNNTAAVPLTILAETPVSPTTSSSGGGGCVYRADGPFDPTLLALAGLAAAGLGIGRWRRRGRQSKR